MGANRQRAVGCTDVSEQASRSHLVFALHLRGTNQILGSEVHGVLHIVDLAGSECLKDTQNINRSLSSLADVFAAKAEGRTPIPFRNSKLTHLMEPCLSGQGKTLVLVTVEPERDNAPETLCSLRFARQIGHCSTGGKKRRSKINLGQSPAASSPRALQPSAMGSL